MRRARFTWTTSRGAGRIGAAVGQAARRNPETEVQLRADQAVPYGRMVEVMGAAQKAGLNRIGFVADADTSAAGAAQGATRKIGQSMSRPGHIVAAPPQTVMQEKYNHLDVEPAAQAHWQSRATPTA